METAQTMVAVYLRVSSDDQRERETIKTQREAAERFLASHAEFRVYRWYTDDGVSGTIPMAKRPDGRHMVEDARAGKFAKIVVYRSSRLGREEEDKFAVYNLFVEDLGIEFEGIMEDLKDRMVFGFHTVIDAYARRQLLVDSARGMDRAAREGRYTGGITALGYRVEGYKHTSHLVPDDSRFWGDWTAVRLVERIYEWLGLEGRSCRWVAHELNRLGVPTAYQRAGRGVRGQKTQALWRPGRIRNLVVNPIYKGVLAYGRRRNAKSKRTEVIEAGIEPLVSAALWDAAQQALLDNRIAPKNTRRSYLLRGVIKCGLCGLAFCGAQGRKGVWWYRCNGYLAERGGKDMRCLARSIRNTDIEDEVWSDIEALLRNPGDLIARLEAEAAHREDSAAALQEAGRVTLEAALAEVQGQRDRTLELFKRGHISSEELDADMLEMTQRRKDLEQRLDALSHTSLAEEVPLSPDILEELNRRLDEGLSDEMRGEVVRVLVRQITVYTTVNEKGRKDLRIVVEYRFPWCNPDLTGMDSWLPQA